MEELEAAVSLLNLDKKLIRLDNDQIAKIDDLLRTFSGMRIYWSDVKDVFFDAAGLKPARYSSAKLYNLVAHRAPIFGVHPLRYRRR